MGKYSKFSSSTEWRLGENVVLRPVKCLTRKCCSEAGEMLNEKMLFEAGEMLF